MEKKYTRSKRRAVRQSRRRQQQIILTVAASLIALSVLFLALRDRYQATTDQNTAGINPGVTANPSGLIIEEINPGAGEPAQAGDTVQVHYTGWLDNGKKFDSSIGGSPLEFTLGAVRVIPGWEEGILGMQVGERRKLIIPPNLAYSTAGFGGVIPPNATLTFEVELVAIK